MNVRWTRLALSDLDQAYAYIAADNPEAAQQLLARIRKATGVLARHPAAGRPGRIPGSRELVVAGTPFVIPYRMERSGIEILAIIHGSRKWPDEL